MIKCILFDNDGTLIDSEELGHRALAAELQAYQIIVSADSLRQRFSGWKLAFILDELSREYKTPLADTFFPQFRSRLTALFEQELQTIPHIPWALDNIHLKKAVVSGGPIEKIQQGLKVTGIGHHFEDRLVSSYEYNTWKPEPNIYWHALEFLGFNKEECLIVEDSDVGLEAGIKSGIKTLFYNPSGRRDFPKEASSFSCMKQLPGIINGFK